MGRYNYRRRIYTSAVWRLQDLVEDFPEFQEMDKVLFLLGMSYGRNRLPEEAIETFEQLRAEYPDSPYIKKIPDTSKFKTREKKQT